MQASRYIPDIRVIRAIQKIVWASGCGSLELVFSPNEDITKIYEMVRIRTEIIVLLRNAIYPGIDGTTEKP